MKKQPTQPSKVAKPAPQTKAFNADDFVTVTLPREEVIEIRTAF